jgi:hypothetical protein
VRTYNVVLFIHLLGVVLLFGALAMSQRGGMGLRKASTIGEARTWLNLLASTGPMFPIAGVILLVSGLYMANDVWSFSTPWVVVAFWGLIVLQAVGGLVVGNRLQKIGKMAGAAEGGITAEMAGLIADPILWASASSLNSGAVGILWLMTNKPGWGESVGVVVVLAVVGAIAGYMTAGSGRGATKASTPSG